MGLFDKLTKKKTMEEGTSALSLGAVAKGTIVAMEKIPDAVFSTGVLGICCGIEPTEGEIYSPVSGKILQVADTLHAVGIQGPNDVEILIHAGIDTVELNGDGFSVQVEEGDCVKKGDLLFTMDLEKLRGKGYPTTIITAVTNSGELTEVITIASGEVEPGDNMMKVTK